MAQVRESLGERLPNIEHLVSMLECSVSRKPGTSAARLELKGFRHLMGTHRISTS